MGVQYDNPFRLNHLGFTPGSVKRFTYVGDGPDEFTVSIMRDGSLYEVFSGRLTPCPSDPVSGGVCRAGDFTSVKEPGVYRILCGGELSRIFYIDDKVYDPLCRLMTGFFVWQRCCDDAGWNGRCHTHDHLVDKNGVDHDLTGGHHQSGDLRKWAFGVPVGVYGLSEYLRLAHPLWNKGVIEYDIAHSARYFLSRLSDEGYVFDCTFVPEDYDDKKCRDVGFQDYGAFWRSFKYFDRSTDPHGNWMTLRLLSSAALSLRENDPSLADRCLAGARRLWDYMMKTGRYSRDFEWEIYPPIGHSNFKQTVFDWFYPDSAPMLCDEVSAALALFRAEEDGAAREAVLSRAAASLRTLAGYMVTDKDGVLDHFRLSDVDPTPAEEVKYFLVNIPLAFSEALTLCPDHPDAGLWRDVAGAAVMKYRRQSASNAYGIVSNCLSRSEGSKELEPLFYAPSFITDLSRTALFLTESAPLFGREVCLPIAQRLLDFVIGSNPADVSAVEGAGFNQPFHAVFGEYFPCQPQIPGAVFTDFTLREPNHASYGVEYDMPIVGDFLYAMARYTAELTSLS